jgi:heterodisulfide reductase subunit A-like polyferredoxin
MRIGIIGGGISGISAAKVALSLGHEVLVIEREEKIGGLMSRIANCRVGFQTFYNEIKNEPRLKILTGKTITTAERKKDSFLLCLESGENLEVERIVLATGLTVYEPEIKGKRILSSLEYDRMIDQKNDKLPEDFKRIAFVLCVGSRCKDFPLCSAVCCSYTLRQIKWTYMRAHPEITVFYNDLRLFGQEFFLEKLLREGGVRFVRVNSRSFEEDETGVKVRYFTGSTIKEEKFDYLVLTNALRPNPELKRLSEMMGFSLNEYGFVKETLPLRSDVYGIFACGGSLEPMNIKDSILTGLGAGYLASNGKEAEDGRIYRIREIPNVLVEDSGKTFVFYVGVRDPYLAAFYEYFSLKIVELSVKLKEKGKDVYVITRNLIAPSYGELVYEAARRKGVVFIHLEEDEKITVSGKRVKIEGGRGIEIDAERIILMEDFVKGLKDFEILGFLRSEPQLRWSPTKWDNRRFHVGFTRYPRDKRWEGREYYAACAEISLEAGGRDVPQVIEEKCSGCGSCKNSCVAEAIEVLRIEEISPLFGPYLVSQKPFARINSDLCLGCGLCVSTCPSHAIEFSLMKTSMGTQASQGGLL